MDAKTLCDRSGISYRQLDHWCTKGYIRPVGAENPGSGRGREFSMNSMLKATQMKCLIEVGFEPWMASRIAEAYVYQGARTMHLGHGVTLLVESHLHTGGSHGNTEPGRDGDAAPGTYRDLRSAPSSE